MSDEGPTQTSGFRIDSFPPLPSRAYQAPTHAPAKARAKSPEAAVTKLLIEKGIITDAEFKQKLLEWRAVYQRILHPATQ
jgi:hypothetical protein